MTWKSRSDDVPTWSRPERTTTCAAGRSGLAAPNWNSNVDDPQRLLDGRRDCAGPGVDHLVAGHEAVGLDGDRRADHVHDVARPQLARVPHVAVRRDPRPRVPLRGQAQRVEQRERRVAETREVVGDRQVVVVIDLPLVDDAAIGLEAGVHGTRLYNRRDMEMPRRRTLADLLDEMATRHPGREAVVGTSGRLTYGQWRARARDPAPGLHRLRVRRGGKVALLMPNRTEWLGRGLPGAA